jgi:hypothetical protein
VRTDEYYAAGYDPPFTLVNRHNEVWVLKAGDSSHKFGTGPEALLHDLSNGQEMQAIHGSES